jgi:hypothetical protein
LERERRKKREKNHHPVFVERKFNQKICQKHANFLVYEKWCVKINHCVDIVIEISCSNQSGMDFFLIFSYSAPWLVFVSGKGVRR